MVIWALVNATRLPSGDTAANSALASRVVSGTGVPHACVTGSTGTRQIAGTPAGAAST